MSTKHAKNYLVRGVNLENIRNGLELRVVALMESALEKYPAFKPSSYDIQDIYALALNLLPARYIQSGSIVVSGKIPDLDILKAIDSAIARVQAKPTFPETRKD